MTYEITIEGHTFKVPEEANWVAQDDDTEWYWYEIEPLWNTQTNMWGTDSFGGGAQHICAGYSPYPASENLYQIIDSPPQPMPLEEWLGKYPTIFQDPANPRLTTMASHIAALTWRYLSQFIPTDIPTDSSS